mmetsp:Transcript_98884/g.176172  ORF Transcript_98884/g.176172 Transcript_98884/m.176172 type:complete len:257 (-) Transcript_98884:72-842(-)
MYRPLKKSANEPGPGDHKLPAFPAVLPESKDVAAVSHSVPLSPRLKQKGGGALAGPGSYSPRFDQTWESSQSFGFGTTERLGSHEGKVGSGKDAVFATGPDGGKDTWDGPKFSFPQATPPKSPGGTRGKCVPGPGKPVDERSTSKWRRGPSLTISPRLKRIQPAKDVPGPGEYKRADAAEKALSEAPPQCAFPTSKRFGTGLSAGARRQPNSAMPGPGAYSTEEKTRRGSAALGASGPRWSLSGKTQRELTFSTLY